MKSKKLSDLFLKCLRGPFIHTDNSGDYYAERIGDTLYIYLECSSGEEDWRNNFDFPAAPYREMNDGIWFCHRGFLRVWKSVEDDIKILVRDSGIRSAVVSGYSHGAALATLCHEYIWYNRPDLRESLLGYGFGSPRVVFGILPSGIRKRFERFTVIRNIDDIVTHVPPRLFGYSHVGRLLRIGEAGKYTKIDAHRPENIYNELIIYEGAVAFRHNR